jgi:dolichyl-phosphate-mannose--protein O-mannosyl transferase
MPTVVAEPTLSERVSASLSSRLMWLNRPVVAILAVGAIAGAVRFVNLEYPQQRVFDEYYYSKSACIFLGYSNDVCDINSSNERYWRRVRNDTGAWVHPPLGKWMIALGELAFGTDSFGWRVAAAATGTATVMALAGIVQLLFSSPLWTFTGGLLLAVESLHFVQSRTAMLDVFVTFWIVLALLFLLLDRRWIENRKTQRIHATARGERDTVVDLPPDEKARFNKAAKGRMLRGIAFFAAGCVISIVTFLAAPPGGLYYVFHGAIIFGVFQLLRGTYFYFFPLALAERELASHAGAELRIRLSKYLQPVYVPSPIWRPWRFAAGGALGAGIATKWSALTAIAAVLLISFIWELSRRRRGGLRGALGDAIPAEGFGLVLAFLVVPLIVYVISYVGWFAHFGFDLPAWRDLQDAIYDYHRTLRTIDEKTGEPVHAYLSQAWKWILLWRPVFYYADYGEGVRQVIYANGNPAIFWGALLAVPYTAFAWWRKRDWRAGFIVVAVAMLYVPWLLVPRPQFFFYTTPITPFLVLACVYALRDLADVRYRALHTAGRADRSVRPYLPVTVAFVLVAVGLFVWFWPVLTGAPVTDEAWTLRVWFPSWS